MRNKKLMLVTLLCGLVILASSGCSTIMSGTTQSINISSTPSGAKVTADDGTSITTPGSITFKRKTDHTLVAEYPGYPQKQLQLKRKLNGWIWGNILFGGIIGIVIDSSNGAINELRPKKVHFDFEKPVSDSSLNINTTSYYLKDITIINFREDTNP